MKSTDRLKRNAVNGRNYSYLSSGFVLFVVLMVIVPGFTSCSASKNREVLTERMASEDERISELKADIRNVEKDAEKTIEAVKDKGTFWRLLGLKYMDYRMWGEALNAFEHAVDVYPENASLLYNRGLTSGQMALSADTPEQRASYFNRAELSYRRAISVDSRFTAPFYALSVLLVFELDRPLEAMPLLEDYLRIERSDINGRFLLARVYLEAGMRSEALRLYEEIMDISSDKTEKAEAEDLYRRVAGGEDGS